MANFSGLCTRPTVYWVFAVGFVSVVIVVAILLGNLTGKKFIDSKSKPHSDQVEINSTRTSFGASTGRNKTISVYMRSNTIFKRWWEGSLSWANCPAFIAHNFTHTHDIKETNHHMKSAMHTVHNPLSCIFAPLKISWNK